MHEVVFIATVFHEVETWVMGGTEIRKVNILELKCFRSLVEVTRMDRVGNEEVRQRTGMERELRVDGIREYCDSSDRPPALASGSLSPDGVHFSSGGMGGSPFIIW